MASDLPGQRLWDRLQLVSADWPRLLEDMLLVVHAGVWGKNNNNMCIYICKHHAVVLFLGQHNLFKIMKDMRSCFEQ